ncbi:MAG: LysM peptidoglycan-binding domain-containing protein [Ardenticatenaceae bacterium]|nr:LysM peptidoglycan-binding domain-containing protein [Ardenticatenaceae bacterium]
MKQCHWIRGNTNRVACVAGLLLALTLLPACSRRQPSPQATPEQGATTTVPPEPSTPTTVPSPSPLRATVTPTPMVVYTVQPGDTLKAIAAQYNVTVACLVAANAIANPDLIMPGQEIVIPACEE